MKNAATANLWIVDKTLQRKAQIEGVELLSSTEAWDKYAWTHQYFKTEPTQGYFVWAKQQPTCPVMTCVNIQGKEVEQQLQNLIVIESGLKIEMGGTCSALALKLKGRHQSQGQIVLKPGAEVRYRHLHQWGKQDVVEPNYEFHLEAGSKIDYVYRVLECPEKMKVKNKFFVGKAAKVRLNIIADCKQTEFESTDEIFLQGKNASGISKLRLISREQTRIKAYSRMVANAAATGHLDCQNLNLDSTAQVSLIPEVTVNHDQAQITHEASIGRVSDEQLNYLRMRGLTEQEATDLIAAGFLQPEPDEKE